jgi:MarR family transcriptional regulator, transcriptional regulator for hemolysin
MPAAMDNFAFEVVETARLIRREANRRAAALGATGAQWRVLARLSLRNGVRQVDLAESLDVEPITLCRMVDRLEEAGLVERRRDAEDRRAWRIHLTPAAEPVIEQLREMTGTFNDDLLDGIAEADARTVRRVLDQLRRNLDRVERPLEAVS